jgi:predicted NUDIX family NTP pyrophosphohydrolase
MPGRDRLNPPVRPRVSAGIVLYRPARPEIEVLIAHPGGPFFKKKDEGHWTIPKGEPDRGEDMLAAAQREFFEEVGFYPQAPFIDLGTIQQKGGKIVHAWASQGDFPPGHEHTCNTFEMEWPLGSGRYQSFPEIDKVCFFPISDAKVKLKPTQIPLLDRLVERLTRVSGG